MDNLKEMDKFPETYNLPKLNQKEKENLNRPITSNEIKLVIKKLHRNKSPGPKVFTGEFYQMFKEQLVSKLFKLFQKKEKKRKTSKFIL